MHTNHIKRLPMLIFPVALLATFLFLPITTMAASASGQTPPSHFSTFKPETWPSRLQQPLQGKLQKTSDTKHAKIDIDPHSIVESTRGNFATSVYAKGLQPNVLYTLTDANVTCIDTINVGATVLSDLDGRFSYPLAGGPFYFDTSPLCISGTYTVTATPTSGPSYTTTFKIQEPRLMLPARAFVSPDATVESTDGSFSTSLFLRGLPPNKSYRFSDNLKCTDDINEAAPLDITVDNLGNANIVLFGGPAFFPGNEVCTPGSYAVTLKDLAKKGIVFKAKFTILSPRP